MTRKSLFPGTDLDLKIKKNENAERIQQQRLLELPAFFGLDKEKFNPLDPSPWRKLCFEMALHLVPGFKLNKSGNKRINSAFSDYEIYQFYNPLVTAQYQFDDEARQEWIDKKLSKKQRIAHAAEKAGCNVDKARRAIQRIEKFLQEKPEAFYHPDFTDSYVSTEAHPDRHEKNKKKK